MRINKISLNNYRIYKGNNQIDFSFYKENKNISIIAGQNGFGKTTFLSALVWGFYGKLIADVDEKYKREIYESGGYKKYAKTILNKEIFNGKNETKIYSVKIELSDVYIPSVPCKKIIIKREFNVDNEKENIKILIDGFENELTKEVGADMFINDFILPREIAKFFLFDAEKIVSLAEIKTIHEKRKLSKAYSEVLGINKYENLKKNLESLRLKLRKKSASTKDRNKLEKLQSEVANLEKLVEYNESKIKTNNEEIERLKSLSEEYQEKLIREGNTMTAEDLIQQKKLRDTLKAQSIEIKAKLKELIELAPFAIAGIKTKLLYSQIKAELKQTQNQIDIQFFKTKIESIQEKINKQLKNKSIPSDIKDEVLKIVSNTINENIEEQKNVVEKVLLDLTTEQSNEFFAIYDNLKHSFHILFKQIVKEERNNRIFLAKTLKKISNAESKESDVLSKKYKSEKINTDKKINELNSEQNKLYEEIGALQQELATKSKLISELSKMVKLDDLDDKKDKVTSRLIDQLNEFIVKYKSEKKYSLQQKIKQELSKLMHKKDFIAEVEVEINEDVIEINLIDKKGNLIDKDSLSKGEQQLYATALLKSLVDESGIRFPVFIDSPLQKFDKKHSQNIITEFYPTISSQVILFPLLEKELTKKEYELLLPFVSQTYFIDNDNGSSQFKECKPNELFNLIENKNNVYTY